MKEMKKLPISADAQKSIKAFFYDFCMYMEENYCATHDQLMLDWNSVGATARFIGNGHKSSIVFGNALTAISAYQT